MAVVRVVAERVCDGARWDQHSQRWQYAGSAFPSIYALLMTATQGLRLWTRDET